MKWACSDFSAIAAVLSASGRATCVGHDLCENSRKMKKLSRAQCWISSLTSTVMLFIHQKDSFSYKLQTLI